MWCRAFTACWSGVSAVRGRSSSHEARHWSGVLPWCLQTKERGGRLAGDAQQLAASTACIGSELVACLRGHKKCRKKLLASVLKDTSKNLYASPPGAPPTSPSTGTITPPSHSYSTTSTIYDALRRRRRGLAGRDGRLRRRRLGGLGRRFRRQWRSRSRLLLEERS